MSNKIMGLVLVLFGLALGIFDCGPTFRNGLHEGLGNLDKLFQPQQMTLLIAAIVAILIGLAGLFKKKK